MAANETSFRKGHAKVGGIKKGQKNRTTEMIHRIFDLVERDFYDEETGISQFDEDMAKLTPKDRRDVYLRFLKTVMPTITSLSIEDNKTTSTMRQLMMSMASYNRNKE